MYQFPESQLVKWLRLGYSADPGPELLLDKSKIAQIRVRQLEMVIKDMEAQLELTRMELGMLREEYKQ